MAKDALDVVQLAVDYLWTISGDFEYSMDWICVEQRIPFGKRRVVQIFRTIYCHASGKRGI